jgi:GTP pyrophosphokinase
VFGGHGERVEIQIRTKKMDEVAKSGIAAHWKYKEGKPTDEELQHTFAWLQNLIENQEHTKDPKEFLQNVRLDLFPEEVNVFTPGGEAKTLPKGSTPIDFAYHIHTEVGHQCTGAKVNGRIVPIRYELQTGDVVEILTTKGHHPSKDWLAFVKTVKAKNRIRQWIKAEDKERSISLGKEMCDKTFRKYKLGFNTLMKSEEMTGVLADFGFKTTDDLLASVGYGKITPLQLVHKFMPSEAEPQKAEIPAVSDKPADKVIGVEVKGLGNVMIRFGKCCQPLPGDEITGYITIGQGITIHRADCANLLQMNPERQMDVEWSSSEEITYPARIRLRSRDKVGLLAELTKYISNHSVNILALNSELTPDNIVEAMLTIAVKDRSHLKQVISAIKKMKEIIEVVRIDS